MSQNLTAIIEHPHSTKVFSLILGYSLWICIAQHQSVTKTYQAPIYLYDTNSQATTNVDTVKMIVQGPRKEMYHFSPAHSAVHLDGSKLQEGHNEISLSKENFFLPDGLKLIDLVPSHITIHINSIEKT